MACREALSAMESCPRRMKISIGAMSRAAAQTEGLSKRSERQLWEEGGWVFTDERGRPIKYEPFGTTQMLVQSGSGQTMTFEAAVSPWIITPDLLIAPLAMNVPELPISSSGFDFRIDGVESTGHLSNRGEPASAPMALAKPPALTSLQSSQPASAMAQRVLRSADQLPRSPCPSPAVDRHRHCRIWLFIDQGGATRLPPLRMSSLRCGPLAALLGRTTDRCQCRLDQAGGMLGRRGWS